MHTPQPIEPEEGEGTSLLIRAYARLIRRWYPAPVDPALVRAEIDRWWLE